MSYIHIYISRKVKSQRSDSSILWSTHFPTMVKGVIERFCIRHIGRLWTISCNTFAPTTGQKRTLPFPFRSVPVCLWNDTTACNILPILILTDRPFGIYAVVVAVTDDGTTSTKATTAVVIETFVEGNGLAGTTEQVVTSTTSRIGRDTGGGESGQESEQKSGSHDDIDIDIDNDWWLYMLEDVY